jgi:lipopolysaccharide/colanic/teichoic acid biosynthesis glycosyltransferase
VKNYWNIDMMSFVQIIYLPDRRLSMKPGITGLWQVSGRNTIHNFEEWVKLDLEYIDNWSFLLDFRIAIKTVSTVLSGTGM